MNEIILKPKMQLQEAEDGSVKPVTTSLAVAECFGKRHDHVLRDIDKIIQNTPTDYHRPNFGEVFRDVLGNNGAIRQMPMYLITRDGFALLAMGFTGQKALEWKIAFINAYNQLEANELARLSKEKARKMAEYEESDPKLFDAYLAKKGRVETLESEVENLRSQELKHELFEGFLHLIPLFRCTHSAERNAFTLNYFLTNKYIYYGWQQLSYRQLGETLRLAYPYGVSSRIKYLIERGYLHAHTVAPNKAKYYHVDAWRIVDDLINSGPLRTLLRPDEATRIQRHIRYCEWGDNPYDDGHKLHASIIAYPEMRMLSEPEERSADSFLIPASDNNH